MKPCGICYPDVCYLVDKMTLFCIEDSLSGDLFCVLSFNAEQTDHKSLAPVLDCAESSQNWKLSGGPTLIEGMKGQEMNANILGG